MPDERVASDPIEEIANLRKEFEDFKSTLSIRTERRPTGSIEHTLRTTPLSDTIFLQGQTLLRADYPKLWNWIDDQVLVNTNLFGVGNGTTTFVVPDMRGRLIVGAGMLGVDNYTVGQSGGSVLKTLLTANLPSHGHSVSVSNHTIDVGSDIVSHTHGFNTAGVGGHGGHHPFDAPGSAGSTAQWPTIDEYVYGAHGHGGGTGNANSPHDHYVFVSNHSVAQTAVGSGQGFDCRQPFLALNMMMWV